MKNFLEQLFTCETWHSFASQFTNTSILVLIMIGTIAQMFCGNCRNSIKQAHVGNTCLSLGRSWERRDYKSTWFLLATEDCVHYLDLCTTKMRICSDLIYDT